MLPQKRTRVYIVGVNLLFVCNPSVPVPEPPIMSPVPLGSLLDAGRPSGTAAADVLLSSSQQACRKVRMQCMQ